MQLRSALKDVSWTLGTPEAAPGRQSSEDSVDIQQQKASSLELWLFSWTWRCMQITKYSELK